MARDEQIILIEASPPVKTKKIFYFKDKIFTSKLLPQIEIPKQIPGTYDNFDIDYNYHCVINFNSGPAVQAAIDGTPIICNLSSLAADISGSISDIENIKLPDRSDWFLKLCHTEWTIDEISQGIPLKRLESNIENS
jgi:hypothetical protein